MEKNELITKTLDNFNNIANIEITPALLSSEEFSNTYETLSEFTSKVDEMLKTLKSKILTCLETEYGETGEATIKNNKYQFTYVAPTSSVTVDNGKLKKDFPEVYKECLKTSSRSASVKITAIKQAE
jgi:predicted phage-related endonuclease